MNADSFPRFELNNIEMDESDFKERRLRMTRSSEQSPDATRRRNQDLSRGTMTKSARKPPLPKRLYCSRLLGSGNIQPDLLDEISSLSASETSINHNLTSRKVSRLQISLYNLDPSSGSDSKSRIQSNNDDTERYRRSAKSANSERTTVRHLESSAMSQSIRLCSCACNDVYRRREKEHRRQILQLTTQIDILNEEKRMQFIIASETIAQILKSKMVAYY
jgi:hypothetical protein